MQSTFLCLTSRLPNDLGQYRIIRQERFASKFCALIRRGFAAILSYCKKSQRNQGEKFPQSAAALIMRCCLKLMRRADPFFRWYHTRLTLFTRILHKPAPPPVFSGQKNMRNARKKGLHSAGFMMSEHIPGTQYRYVLFYFYERGERI